MQINERNRVEKLVRYIKAGKIKYIKELHYQISIPIRHIALKYLHNCIEVEDLVQDFWKDMEQILESYHYNKNAYGYLCKVIKNRAIDRYRQLNRHATVNIEKVDYEQYINKNELSVEEVDLYISINQGIKELPNIQAIIIQSIYFEKKTIREIAKELNMSKSEVDRQKHNAIIYLKKFFE